MLPFSIVRLAQSAEREALKLVWSPTVGVCVHGACVMRGVVCWLRYSKVLPAKSLRPDKCLAKLSGLIA